MEDRKITAWVTKYALIGGIMKVEGERSRTNPSMLSWMSGGDLVHAHGLDWHLDEASAKDRADKLRCKKIEELRRQIAKLEELKF